MTATSFRSVGDEVTADVIRRYIEYQTHEDNSIQLKMFESLTLMPPSLLGGSLHFSLRAL